MTHGLVRACSESLARVLTWGKDHFTGPMRKWNLKGRQNYHTVTWGPVKEPPKQVKKWEKAEGRAQGHRVGRKEGKWGT